MAQVPFPFPFSLPRYCSSMARILVAAVALLGCSQAVSVTPVQKVLEMMNEMKAHGEKMLEEEVKTYKTYAEWVSDQSAELGFQIKTATSDIEKYTAEASKADSDVASLSSKIEELNTELASTEAAKAEATKIRNEQHAEYVEISTDYGESVDALERAIQTMEAKNYNVPEAEAFLQKLAASKPGIRRVLAEFILVGHEDAAKGNGAPSVAAYEFQSGGIIALMEKFLKKFQGELDEVEREESNEAHNYDMEMVHMSDTIDYLKKELEEKQTLKAKRAADAAP